MKYSKQPIVSVVVPMYNVEKYIETCLDSVLAQTFHHFEVICVDDGSSDNTAKIVARYNDSRIVLIQQQNRGLSGARNTGIQAARGMYVALLDSDDYWAPEKLARHVNHLNSRPKVGVSYSPSLFVNDDGELMGIGQFPQLKRVTSKTVFCRNPVGNGSAPVIRRQLLLKMNLNSDSDKRLMVFDESLRQSEDIELWTRIALNTRWKFEGIPQPLTYYRVNASGLSANVQNQLNSWKKAMQANRAAHPGFFKRNYQLAKAYQLRYLARRAVQSGDSSKAISLIHNALFCHLGILYEEPKRTLLTYGCAVLSLLPKDIYKRLESYAMQSLSDNGHTKLARS